MSMGHAIFRRFAVVRQRTDIGSSHAAAPEESSHAAVGNDPERLERIANYARAGYFNLGYTLDMFHALGEFAPE
ncbi:hypothetical protein [Paraburkholderia youngii]|uniref:hypothetical protein n=1 Tax=Paraburkholderia youngii TaxID=2782701 RepID=UPI003D1F5A1C